MFGVSGGGNLSTDSPVRRQKRFQSVLRKFQRFTRSLWTGTLNLGGVMRKSRCCDRGNFPRTVGCPGRNSRRPGLDWCRRSKVERRNLLFPFGYTTVQDCWMLPRNPGSHRPGMLCCNPS